MRSDELKSARLINTWLPLGDEPPIWNEGWRLPRRALFFPHRSLYIHRARINRMTSHQTYCLLCSKATLFHNDFDQFKNKRRMRLWMKRPALNRFFFLFNHDSHLVERWEWVIGVINKKYKIKYYYELIQQVSEAHVWPYSRPCHPTTRVKWKRLKIIKKWLNDSSVLLERKQPVSIKTIQQKRETVTTIEAGKPFENKKWKENKCVRRKRGEKGQESHARPSRSPSWWVCSTSKFPGWEG